MSTPRTDDVMSAYRRGACGTMCVEQKMQELERELAAANMALAAITTKHEKVESELAHYKAIHAAIGIEGHLNIPVIQWKQMRDELDGARKDTARLDKIERSIKLGNFNQTTGRTEITEFNCHLVIKNGLRSTLDAIQEANK